MTTFLPIVGRELLTRSRQWPTYWVRVIVGFFGVMLCLQQLEISSQFSGAAQAGRMAFRGLVVVGFIICCCGCLATADAISWERREKTLGLLFLTRVRGTDILLGKLTSHALVLLCALVAFLPILMLPVLAGGVGGREAVHTGLMMLDTLMLSLTAGLYASARHEQWFKSVRAAVGIMVMLLVLPVLVQVLFQPVPAVGLLSPLYGVTFAATPGLAFWISLGLVQLTAWFLLWLAVRQLRLSLRDAEGETKSAVEQHRPTWAPHVVVMIRPLLRVGAQPIGWLLRRQRGIKAMVWCGAICSVLFYGFRMVVPVFSGIAGSAWMMAWPVAFAGTVASGGLFAWATSRFLFEARRSGEFELLVTTPVGAKTIIWEQWVYLRRLFRAPLVVMLLPLLLQVCVTFLQVGQRGYAGSSAWQVTYLISTVLGMGNYVLCLLAICWTGMWFGMKARTQAIAVFQTVAWVRVLPYLLSYVSMLVSRFFVTTYNSSGAPVYMAYFVMSWLPQIFTALFYLWLIRVMRRRLLGEIRDAEALSLSFRGGYAGRWLGLKNWFRRVRHWTPL